MEQVSDLPCSGGSDQPGTLGAMACFFGQLCPSDLHLVPSVPTFGGQRLVSVLHLVPSVPGFGHAAGSVLHLVPPVPDFLAGAVSKRVSDSRISRYSLEIGPSKNSGVMFDTSFFVSSYVTRTSHESQ